MLNWSTKHTETRFRVVIGRTKMGIYVFIQMSSVQRGPGVKCVTLHFAANQQFIVQTIVCFQKIQVSGETRGSATALIRK